MAKRMRKAVMKTRIPPITDEQITPIVDSIGSMMKAMLNSDDPAARQMVSEYLGRTLEEACAVSTYWLTKQRTSSKPLPGSLPLIGMMVPNNLSTHQQNPGTSASVAHLPSPPACTGVQIIPPSFVPSLPSDQTWMHNVQPCVTVPIQQASQSQSLISGHTKEQGSTKEPALAEDPELGRALHNMDSVLDTPGPFVGDTQPPSFNETDLANLGEIYGLQSGDQLF